MTNGRMSFSNPSFIDMVRLGEILDIPKQNLFRYFFRRLQQTFGKNSNEGARAQLKGSGGKEIEIKKIRR